MCVHPDGSSAPQLATPPSVSVVPPLAITFSSPSVIVQETSLANDPEVQLSSIISPAAAVNSAVPDAPSVKVAPSTTTSPLTRMSAAYPFHPSPHESAILNV